MTLLLLALLAALSQDPPARESASGFTLVRPKGWSRQEIPNQNMVGLMPPGPAAQQCSLFNFGGQNGDLNELVFHDKLFQAGTQGSRIDWKISGAYEFRKWSLILRFDTGFVQSIQVGFDAEDPSTAKSIFINGTSFERLKTPATAPK